MKRIIMTIILAATLIIAFSGFMTVENKPVDLIDCRLTANDANLQILPGTQYRQSSVSLRVIVEDDQRQHVADGFRKIELLQIPATGISFRVPLSKPLASDQKYRVTVTVDCRDSESAEKEWLALGVSGTSSDDFFTRRFKPISEPANMRHQVSAISIRKNLL